jgi:hypothetical protein
VVVVENQFKRKERKRYGKESRDGKESKREMEKKAKERERWKTKQKREMEKKAITNQYSANCRRERRPFLPRRKQTYIYRERHKK